MEEKYCHDILTTAIKLHNTNMRCSHMIIYMSIIQKMYYLYISGPKCVPSLNRLSSKHKENMILFSLTKNVIHLDTKMSSLLSYNEYISTKLFSSILGLQQAIKYII